jgi:hypothetical protein
MGGVTSQLKIAPRSTGPLRNLRRSHGHGFDQTEVPGKLGMSGENQIHSAHFHGATMDLGGSTVHLHRSRMIRWFDPGKVLFEAKKMEPFPG